MKLLLSIKPRFADLIFSGEKRYEFRKSIFRRSDVKSVVVYASHPISKAIGEFEIETVIEDDLERLWEATRAFAGISEEFFFDYFSNRETGYAIKVKSYTVYEEPYCIRTVLGMTPPQSFAYIDV